MNIALIGYGKMGKEIESIANYRGHKISLIIDLNNRADLNNEKLKDVDVAIEFTIPESAVMNFKSCFDAGVPVVCGTTGWLNRMEEVREMATNAKCAFFFTPNYSLGVNIFFKVNQFLARIMNNYPEYEVDMVELHHTQKLDAPSGTAIRLADDIVKNMDRKKKWDINSPGKPEVMNIQPVRRVHIPGTHTIYYDSHVDFIEITHSAKGRRGFALGAVMAAEFIKDQKPGVYNMDDMLKL